MKKLMNDPKLLIKEMVQGLAKSHPDKVSALNEVIVVRKEKNTGKVNLISGGGSGMNRPMEALLVMVC